jgi:anion transporter
MSSQQPDMASLPAVRSGVAAAAGIVSLFVLLVVVPSELTPVARLALGAFGGATIAWVMTPISPAFVAVAAAAVLAVIGVVPQEVFTSALGHDIIWLMIGAFILGEAIATTGLAARLTRSIASRARRVDQLFWLVSAALLPLTFVIPSTSGRASVALPLHRSLTNTLGDAGIARALTLLIPTVILVTTIAALTGAGSHLIVNDVLAAMTGRRIGLVNWIVYGLPFALAAGAIACFVILRLFLNAEQRMRRLVAPPVPDQAWSQDECMVATVAVLMLGLWLTESWHGLSIAMVALLGAVALMSPGGVLSWKSGLKAVSWDLVLFVGAALVLGKALIDTGAAGWLTGALFSAIGLAEGMSSAAIIAAVAAITLVAHLVMTSHAARAAALVPPLVALGDSLELNPVAVVFIGTVGMNYCQTLPVSSKALLMFQDGENGIRPADLVRLSAILAPLHLALVMAFYFGYWRFVGLAL